MIYLLLGTDGSAKDKRVEEIKKKSLGSTDAFFTDSEVLHAPKLDPAKLKESLMALPAIAKRRLVIIRSMDKMGKLDDYNKQLILDFLSNKQEHLDIVFDFDGNGLDKYGKKKSFLSKLEKFSKCEKFDAEKDETIFDVGDLVFKHRLADALKLLFELLERGEDPVNLIGGLLWKWSQKKNALSTDKYKKCLLKFQEADYNIKRSKTEPEYALEVLLVSLSQIIT